MCSGGSLQKLHLFNILQTKLIKYDEVIRRVDCSVCWGVCVGTVKRSKPAQRKISARGLTFLSDDSVYCSHFLTPVTRRYQSCKPAVVIMLIRIHIFPIGAVTDRQSQVGEEDFPRKEIRLSYPCTPLGATGACVMRALLDGEVS